MGFLYFTMLIIWLFVYSTTINNDSASYLNTYGITSGLLSNNPIYSFIITVLMVFLAFKSRRLLFNISKALIIIILVSFIILSLLIIPYWNPSNIMPLASYWTMLKNIIITLPFAMTSILFLQSLSPMIIAIRSRIQSRVEARKGKAIKIMNTSFFILVGIVFFFALSCTLAINHKEACQAFKDNASFLTILAKHIPGITIPAIGIAIDIFAIMTSFFGVLLGFREACMGLSINIFMKGKNRKTYQYQKTFKICNNFYCPCHMEPYNI